MLRAVAIVRVEAAAIDDRNLQRREVAVGDDPVIGGRLTARLGERIAVHDVPRAAVVGAERQHVDETGSTDAGNACDGFGGANEETPLRAGIGIAIFGERHRQREDVVRIEPRIDFLKVSERAHEQSRRHEQEQRQRHFADHQSPPQAPMRSAGRAVAARFQRLARARAAGLQGRHAAEEQCTGQRHRDREDERQPIDTEVEDVRLRNNEQLRQRIAQDAQSAEPERQADGGAGARQQDAFRQHLPDETQPAGAERRAHGELALSRDGAREQQIGDVRAREQQHHADCGQCDQRHRRGLKRFPEPPHLEQLGAQPAVRLRIVGFPPVHHGVELGLCALVARLGLQPRDRHDRRRTGSPRQRVRRALESGPRFTLEIEDRELESPRHHAHDRVRRAVEHHDAADNRWVAAEAALPQSVAEQDDTRRLGLSVARRQRTSGRGVDAEQRERLRRHLVSLNALGHAAAGEVRAPVLVRRDAFKRSHLPADIDRVGERQVHRPLMPRRVGPEDERHPRRVAVRERLQRQNVDDAEGGGVDADADSQRQYGGRGETGRTAQHAEAVGDVLPERAHRVVSCWRGLVGG